MQVEMLLMPRRLHMEDSSQKIKTKKIGKYVAVVVVVVLSATLSPLR